jgi:hypothetical protein
MVKRVPFVLVGAILGCVLLAPSSARAQGADVKAPKWLYGLALKCRKGGQPDFDAKALKFGVEVFKNENNGNLLYVSEAGHVAVLPGGAFNGPAKDPTWLHGLDLKCRKSGQADFTPDTPKIGVEVFKDENTGNLIYISETGCIAVVAGGGAPASPVKGPKWLHGLELRCRKGGEADFSKDTKKFGVEAFKDENNGNLVYVSEVGSIAVLPGAGAPAEDVKGPKWLHGLEVKCRKGGQADFDKNMPKIGVEAFKDDNNGHLVYISEAGTITALPNAGAPAADVKPPTWQHGLDLKCRKAGQADFDEKSPRIGVEVFKDDNNGNLLYITDSGSLATLAGPK